MVDSRSSNSKLITGLALIFVLAGAFHPTRVRAAGIAAQPASLLHRKRAHPKPPKPVPLGELTPVPIELGTSGANPLATFFDALAKLQPGIQSPTVAPATTPATPAQPPEAPTSQPPASVEPQSSATPTPLPTQTAPTPEAPATPNQQPPSPQSAIPAPPTQPDATSPSAPAQVNPPEAAAPQIVHIIHFGDSHVASDYWAGVLREKFHARFGNAGPGFVLPGRPWPSIRYADARSLDGVGWRTDGLRYTERDGVVGLGGMSLESYREPSPASASAVFSQFQIFAATSPGNSCFKVQVDDADVPSVNSDIEHIVPAAPEANPATQLLVPEPSPNALGGGAAAPPLALSKKNRKKRKAKHVSPDPPFNPWPAGSPLDLVEMGNSAPLAIGPHQVSIRSSCGSWGRLLGAELYNGSLGVVYDTDGVNGARLADLEKPLPALRTALLKQAQPTLIIVSYGTNDIGMRGFDAQDYEERAYQILVRLKQDAGDASILVTGPSDRGSARKKTRLLIQAGQAQLQPALRKAALRAGCAFWDEQAAMGGPGSMANWRRAGLANYDYVHFMGAGYQKLADMLYDQLMVEYAKYSHPSAPQAQ